MPNKYFKTYQEAWEFVHKFATGGYDHNKQAEACEAFRMMNEAANFTDMHKTRIDMEEYESNLCPCCKDARDY